MRALACIAALVFAGCDAAAPEAPPSLLVGSWEPQVLSLDTYATLAQPADALDVTAPGTGTLRVLGAASAPLTYFDQRLSNSFGDGALTAFVVASEPETVLDSKVVLGVTVAGGARLDVVDPLGAAARAFYPECADCSDRLVIRGDTLRAAPTRFVEFGTGAAVVVEGTLVLPRRRLEAGLEVVLSRRSLPNPFANVAARTFERDGTYRTLGAQAGSVLTGRWEDVGAGRVRITVGNLATEYRYAVLNDALTLTDAADRCSAQCLLDAERFYGLPRGSVAQSRVEAVTTLSRVRL